MHRCPWRGPPAQTPPWTNLPGSNTSSSRPRCAGPGPGPQCREPSLSSVSNDTTPSRDSGFPHRLIELRAHRRGARPSGDQLILLWSAARTPRHGAKVLQRPQSVTSQTSPSITVIRLTREGFTSGVLRRVLSDAAPHKTRW